MKILVTGANGFVGRNLVLALKELALGNDRTRPNLKIDAIFPYDIGLNEKYLEDFCKNCDFVFNLAGVNRPSDPKEYMDGNFGFLAKIVKILIANKHTVPIMLSSSIQASMTGRYAGSEYGKSKAAAEQLAFQYAQKFNTKAFVYRFPNLFGKWCKPNYNSAVATFCYNYAHDLPIQVNDPNVELELLYIDDLIKAMLDMLEGYTYRCEYNGLDLIYNKAGRYCFCPVTHKVTIKEIVEDLELFKYQPESLLMAPLEDGSFTKKLYSTYLSYLPAEKTIFDLKTNVDTRGSFTEILKTVDGGQFSVNISKPGVTKGQHFHNSKWEFFIVVKGRALIQERNLLNNELYQFQVSGDKLQAVHMLPGYTHKIVNLDQSRELITLMWANEMFDQERPDTFHEEV